MDIEELREYIKDNIKSLEESARELKRMGFEVKTYEVSDQIIKAYKKILEHSYKEKSIGFNLNTNIF